MSGPGSVNEYLSTFAGPARELLDQLRALCDDADPRVTEAIRWGAPAWLHPSGTILFMISGHARWCRIVFTPSTRAAFTGELSAAGLETGKGSVKLPYGHSLPADLLRRMIAHRVREHEDDGVGWM
ncbi:iron chaperone [Micromonospora sp. NPDC050187]|uniref:iron chaperone n=1 Tax=Micromonospora sp. NPDC050187 TaxID=3364277 RepID=UPI0037928F2D